MVGRQRPRAFLVTGGCGFIGSPLVAALLRRGDAVRVLDDLSTGTATSLPPGVELIRGDVRDGAVVADAMAGVDGCFHLAAIASVERSERDRVASRAVNLGGTVNVLDAARRVSVDAPLRVVYASSASVYGEGMDPPVREDAAARPVSGYGTDKLAAETRARIAGLRHGVPSVGLRFFNVFGPRRAGSSAAGVASIFCERIFTGRHVTVFGDGRQTRDFVHVDDAVAALMAAMDTRALGQGVLNVCTGRATSVRELAQAIAELCGTTLRIEPAPVQEGHVRASVGDPSLARSLLGFSAGIELRAGLAAMLNDIARACQEPAALGVDGGAAC